MRIAIVLLLLVLSFTACKRCYKCAAVCYTCVNGPKFCSSDFASPEQMQAVMNQSADDGHPCTKDSTGTVFKLCDDKSTAENFKHLLWNSGVSCE